MRDALKSYLTLAAGLAEVPRQRALAAAKALVSSGEATAEQVSSLAEDLIEQTKQNREAVVVLVGSEVDRALGRIGLASADEVISLRERVRVLEAEARRSASATPAPAKKAPAKKAAAKKAAAQKQAHKSEAAKVLHAEAEAERAPSAGTADATVTGTPASPA